MPAYVPPHLRGKTVAVAASGNKTRRVKFIGNALGNTDEEKNTGVRHGPTHGNPRKKTLKSVRMLSPTKASFWEPSFALRKAAPKFAKAVLGHLGLKEWSKGQMPSAKKHSTKKRKTKKSATRPSA